MIHAQIKNTRDTVNNADLSNSLSQLNSLALDSSNYVIDLLDNLHPQRESAETFIKNVYHDAYNASISSFYPLLLTIQTSFQTPELSAVAGLRPAEGEQLFLEKYLSQPIDQILDTDRHRIIEIGNLAPSSAGQSRWLVATLNAFMLTAGFSHVVFTATPRLQNTFSRMGLPLVKLADADASVLTVTERNDWGTYYQQSPSVFVGNLYDARDAFDSIPMADIGLSQIITQANRLGRTFSYGFNYH